MCLNRTGIPCYPSPKINVRTLGHREGQLHSGFPTLTKQIVVKHKPDRAIPFTSLVKGNIVPSQFHMGEQEHL